MNVFSDSLTMASTVLLPLYNVLMLAYRNVKFSWVKSEGNMLSVFCFRSNADFLTGRFGLC